MAVTSYGVNDSLAMKAWSRKLSVEVSKATAIAPLIGDSEDSIIQIKDELNKDKGDQVTFGLRMQLNGAGVTEGQTLEGNEESLTTYSDAIVVNELAHAVRVKNEGTIDVQRVPFNLRRQAKDGLRDWYADRLSLTFFVHAAGYTGLTLDFEGSTITMNSKYYGFNAPTAPSSTRVIRAGAAANDQSLTSSNIFTLDIIDKALEKAKTANPKIRPIRVDGGKHYVMYIHPYQTTSLRTNTSTGQWLDIQKAAEKRGSSNPIFDGSLGVYNNVILREAEHVVTGVNSSTSAQITTVRRAVLLGAQACVASFGMKFTPEKYEMREELFDYQRELGVSCHTVFGMKKAVFNSVDFGTIVVPTYAAAAT
jgi:N4-gp56 family major capsid protein